MPINFSLNRPLAISQLFQSIYDTPMRSVKVVLVGDTKVGKSCILARFVQGTFDRNMPPTIGAAFLAKVVTTAGGPVRLQLWDTAGQEKFRSLAPMYYRAAAVAVLVYDVTSKTSLNGLEDWAAEIADKAPHNIRLVVVGNKTDLVDERVVPKAAGEELTKKFQAVFYAETSAETGDGINELFTKIAEMDPAQDDVLDAPRRVQPQGQNPAQSGGCC
jgi:small GTP-binding protein